MQILAFSEAENLPELIVDLKHVVACQSVMVLLPNLVPVRCVRL